MRTPDCFSPDGRLVALALDDQRFQVWEVESGRPVGDAVALRADVRTVAFGADAKRVLAASADGVWGLWAADGSRPLVGPLKHGAPLVVALWSPDGKRLLTAGEDRLARLWSAADGSAIGSPLEHRDVVLDAAFSRDGAMVVTACADGMARLWNAGTGAPAGPGFEHPAAVRQAAFSADDQLLWTVAGDDRVRLWHLGQRTTPAAEIRHERLAGADMSPLGKLVATVGGDGFVRVWEPGAGSPLAERRLDAAPGLVRWSPDGERLLVGAGSEVQVWHSAGRRPLSEPMRHPARVVAAGFDRGGERVATLADDLTFRLWDAASGKLVGTPIRTGASGGLDTRLRDAERTVAAGTLVRVGTERLVTVGGVTGVFTPVTTGGDQPLGADERKNLLAIVDQLRREVAEVQSLNLQLSGELAALRERPSAPGDFAAGVQQSLDELQQRLATMRNATSGFAVRQFDLQASVHVQVSPLGTIEYRFVQPGDKTDPQSLSRLSLQVVPVPKDTLAGVWTPNLFQPEVAIAALPGLDDDAVRRLEDAGLYSIGEFMQVGTRARAQAYLAALLGVERQRVALWAQQAMLLTLRGMSGPAALLLIDAGVAGFATLAGLAPEALSALYDQARARRADLGAPALDPALAAMWIRAARQYLGLPDAAPGPESVED